MYEKMLKESYKIDEKIASLKMKIESMPEGKLLCTKNGNNITWRVSNGHTAKYLPKKERWLAEKLAHKKYLSLQLKNLLREKTAIQFYLNHHDLDALKKELEFLHSPRYRELLNPFYTPISSELAQWAKADYEKNSYYPDNLIFQSMSGQRLRSKSEMLIDMVLWKNRIPYRYESALYLGKECIYPDFTIRHPRTGEYYYWEHFGMMDNENYAQKAINKLQLYISHGIIPSIHLITTFETKDHPFDTHELEHIVQKYFFS